MGPGEAANAERLDSLFRQAPMPERPSGWVLGPPTFVGIGAPRCGTSWWFRVIGTHPDVSYVRGAQPKEVHYFWGRRDRPRLTPEEVEEYHRYFPRSPDAPNVGEWTPDYMYSATFPGQLNQTAPEARLLVLLRDPVDRYISGFTRGLRLAAKNGIEGAEPDIADRNAGRGLYFEPVARAIEAFGRDRMLFLQYEHCLADYPGALRRTHEFLGLDPERANMPPQREPRDRDFPEEERRRLAEVYAPDVVKLASLLPELDVSMWANVAPLV
jgi:hypothetical protein